MADLILVLPVPVDPSSASESSQDLRKAIRTAMKLKLESDVKLTALMGGKPLVVTRPTRQFIRLPAITSFDYGTKADDIVPLFDRNYQIDVWTRADFDLAEDIAHRVAGLLDHQPLALPGGEGQVAFLQLQQDRDDTQEDTDISRKTLMFKCLCYEFNGPPPFGE